MINKLRFSLTVLILSLLFSSSVLATFDDVEEGRGEGASHTNTSHPLNDDQQETDTAGSPNATIFSIEVWFGRDLYTLFIMYG